MSGSSKVSCPQYRSARRSYDEGDTGGDDTDDYYNLSPVHHCNFKYDREIASFSNPVTSINFSHDGARCITGCLPGDIKIWDTLHWAEITTLKVVRKEAPTCLFASPGLKWLVCTQPSALSIFKFEEPFSLECRFFARSTSAGTNWICACFSPASVEVDHAQGRTGHDNYLAAVATSHICIYNYSSGWATASQKTQASARFKQAEYIAYSACGGHLLIGYSDGLLQVWNACSLTLSRNLLGHTGPIISICSSPLMDKQPLRMATGGMDGQLRLWSSEGWSLEQIVGDITCDSAGVCQCAFSANSVWLITATTQLCIWRVTQTKRGRWMLRLHQHLEPVCTCAGLQTVAISCIRDAIVVASRDGALGLWSKHDGLPDDIPIGSQTPTEVPRVHCNKRPMSTPIRPMRKMSEISSATQHVMDVIADVDKKSPKNWTHGKIELRPITKSFTFGGHMQARQSTSPLLKKDAWVTCGSPKNSLAECLNVAKGVTAADFLNCMENSSNLDNLDNDGDARLYFARSTMINHVARSNSSPQLGKWASSKNARIGIDAIANATSNIARKKSTKCPPNIRPDGAGLFSAGLKVAK